MLSSCTKSSQKVFRASLGKFGKNLLHPQKCVCSYTYGPPTFYNKIPPLHLITTHVRRFRRITGWLENTTRLRTFIPNMVPTLLEWPSQEEHGSGLTASTLVPDVSAPSCRNGVWPSLRPVSVAQKNKPSTMLSSNVQSIDVLMDCMA